MNCILGECDCQGEQPVSSFPVFDSGSRGISLSYAGNSRSPEGRSLRFNHLGTQNGKVFFCPMLPDLQNSIVFQNVPRPLPACPSGKNIMDMKMSQQYWRNDIDRGNPKCSEKTPLAFVPTNLTRTDLGSKPDPQWKAAKILYRRNVISFL